MNGTVLVAAACGLLASAEAAEWEDPAVNSIGRLPPRTWSVPLAKESDAFTDELWTGLNADNKISLYVRYTDPATGEYEERLVNKYTK